MVNGYGPTEGTVSASLSIDPNGGLTQSAVVREGRPGHKQFVADIVADTLDMAALRKALTSALPDYMVPAVMMCLDSLSLTPNRKLDRKAQLPPTATAPVARPVTPEKPNWPSCSPRF